MSSSQSKRLAAYVRVSAVRGRSGEKFTSPEDQERRIRAWAESQGHEIVQAWHELDVSGGTMDRPMLNEILDRIEAGELDGIVVFGLDRFGRTLIGALQIIERLHEDGKTFASVSDGFDLDTDVGRLVLRIMLSLAQFERDRIKTKWRDIKADRVLEKGWHISRWVPFGYAREELADGNGKPYLGRLLPDPVAAPIVTELFERRAGGEDYSSLSEWMRSTGAVTSRGTGVWSLSSVRSIINNRVYLGEARGGVKGTAANPDAHAPLTDEATWLAANRVRPPRHAPAARGSTQPALGLGLVRCAQCRYVVAISKQPKTPGAFNYMCDRVWRGGHECTKPAMTAAAVRPNGMPTIDDVITERVLRKLDEEPSGFYKVDDPTDVDLPALEAELEHTRARAVNTGQDFELEKRIGTLAWEARCAALDQRVHELMGQLVHVRRTPELTLGRSARDIADDWRAGRLSVEQRREVVANMVQAIFVRRGEGDRRWSGRMNDAKRDAYREALRGRVHIVWVGDEPVDVPHPGHRYTAEPFEFPRG